MVIFAGGEFCENLSKTFHRGGNFHDTTPVSFIKAYGIYYSRGGNFREEDKSAKITHTRKFPRLQYDWQITETTYAKMLERWHISAVRYMRYPIMKTNNGSMTFTFCVYLVMNPPKKPNITPISVPPIAMMKNELMPVTTSMVIMFFSPSLMKPSIIRNSTCKIAEGIFSIWVNMVNTGQDKNKKSFKQIFWLPPSLTASTIWNNMWLCNTVTQHQWSPEKLYFFVSS